MIAMRNLLYLSVIILCLGFLIPGSAVAAGLGEAGSLTTEGLVTGLAVVGVICLAFMGLLLLAKVRELAGLLKKQKQDHIHLQPEDVMGLNADEVELLLHNSSVKSKTSA